jgi:hypothetical protein
MLVPGSTLATLSITYFTPNGFTYPLRRHCCPPTTRTVSSSATDLLLCRHHPLLCPLTATAVVRRCSTLPPIACHHPPPLSPDTVVRQPSSQLSSTAAAIVRHNCQPLDVPVPIVKFIQFTYEGPPYKKLGMVHNLRQEQQKRDPEAVMVEVVGGGLPSCRVALPPPPPRYGILHACIVCCACCLPSVVCLMWLAGFRVYVALQYDASG